MSDEGIICNSCGKRTSKDNAYCSFCGAYLDAEKEAAAKEQPPIATAPVGAKPSLLTNLTPQPGSNYSPREGESQVKKGTPHKKRLGKVIGFFVALFLINALISVFVMQGFRLPTAGYWAVFLGVFLLSFIITGVVFLVAKTDAIHSGGGQAAGVVIGVIILLAIVIPVYITNALAPIISGIGSVFGDMMGDMAESIVNGIANTIGQAISNMFSDITSQVFENVEVPGFEPVLFLGLTALLSLYIIYSYHRKVKKNKI